jgi:hypothetical protein
MPPECTFYWQASQRSGTGPSEPYRNGPGQAPAPAGRKVDACFDRNLYVMLGTKIAGLEALKGAVIEMELLIGPLLERDGGYSYDTFTRAEGLRRSFRYPRVDAARYDQRALVAEARRDSRCEVRNCEMQSEFEQLVGAIKAESGVAAEPGKDD